MPEPLIATKKAREARMAWWERWPDWIPYVATVWSLILSALGWWWGFGGPGFPFGSNDPRAADVGSLFGSAEPTPTGFVMAGIGLLTAVVAWRMSRSVRFLQAQVFLCVAWLMSVFLIVFVPDMRVVQNFAYLFFGLTHLWDLPLLFMLFCMVGGGLWGFLAIGYGRRFRRASEDCGSAVAGSGITTRASWGTCMTYAAVVLALPYPAVRIAWALGVPLGVPSSFIANSDLALRLGEFGLGGIALVGAFLTIGLVRPWGEVFPRRLPFLSGRRVPIWFAVVPASWASAIVCQAGVRIWLWTLTGEEKITSTNWGIAAPGLFWLPWGLCLGAATYAYYRRRKGL